MQNNSTVVHLFLYVFAVYNIFVTRDLDTRKPASVSIHAMPHQLQDHDEVSEYNVP